MLWKRRKMCVSDIPLIDKSDEAEEKAAVRFEI